MGEVTRTGPSPSVRVPWCSFCHTNQPQPIPVFAGKAKSLNAPLRSAPLSWKRMVSDKHSSLLCLSNHGKKGGRTGPTEPNVKNFFSVILRIYWCNVSQNPQGITPILASSTAKKVL
jgi:hypothetical protein